MVYIRLYGYNGRNWGYGRLIQRLDTTFVGLKCDHVGGSQKSPGGDITFLPRLTPLFD